MSGIVIPSWEGPIAAWRRRDVEQAYSTAMLKVAALEAENARLYALLSEQLIRTAGPPGDRETLPAPAPDGCYCVPFQDKLCQVCAPDGCDCDDEKTAETNWLAVAEGD